MTLKPSKSSILAIVVTYNPRQGDLGPLLKALADQDVDTVLIDNCSSNFIQTAEQASAGHNVELIKLDRNYGIAYAQNIGLRKALSAAYEYALLLDQDSLPESQFVRKSLEVFKTLDPEGQNVAAVAPSFSDRSTGYVYPFVRFSRFGVHTFRPSERYANVSLIISSGSMLRLKLLPNIGLMDERLFIDHVDTEWCLKVIAKGYKLVGLRDNVMRHSVGEASIRTLGRNLPVHNPARRYLSTRNLYYLIFHASAPLQWKIKETVTSVLKLCVMLPHVEAPAAHVRAFVRGARDGIAANFARAAA